MSFIFKKLLIILVCCFSVFVLTVYKNNNVSKNNDIEKVTNKADETKETEQPMDSQGNNKVTFTITFDSDGGSKVSNQVIEEGSKIKKPNNPAKKDYEFVEWQLDDKSFDFNSQISKNITIKAIWRKVNNSVDANNNTNQIKETFKVTNLIYTVQSNNIQNYAKSFSTVTLQVICNQKIGDIKINFSNGNSIDKIDKISDNNYMVYYYVRENDPEGYLAYKLNVKDVEGNVYTYTDFDANQRIIVDNTIPTISFRSYSNNVIPSKATVGDEITIEVIGSESLQQVVIGYSNGTGIFNLKPATKINDYTFVVKFIVGSNFSVLGYPLDIEVEYRDLASNIGQKVTNQKEVYARDQTKSVTLYK